MMLKMDINQFGMLMPNVLNTSMQVANHLRNMQHVIVTAQVKSGKRRVKEAVAELSRDTYKHFYLTKLHRRDTRVQLLEMALYGIHCFAIKDGSDIAKLIAAVKLAVAMGFTAVIHLDESDFGTGERQQLQKAFDEFLNNTPPPRSVLFVFYSASNEELQFSTFGLTCQHVMHEPGPLYFGAGAYLANKLAKEAEPFWIADYGDGKKPKKNVTGHFSLQGHEALTRLVTMPQMTFGALRLAVGNQFGHVRRDPIFAAKVKEYGITTVRFIDGNEPFKWGNEPENSWEGYVKRGEKVLLVINQTCTRSTEVGFTDHLAFWHDFRSIDTSYNTVIQALLRPANNLGRSQCMIYGCIASMELQAGLIDAKTFIEKSGRKLSQRVKDDGHARLTEKQYLMELFHPGHSNVEGVYRANELPDEYKSQVPNVRNATVVFKDGKVDSGADRLSKYTRDGAMSLLNRKPTTSDKRDRKVWIDEMNPLFAQSWDKLMSMMKNEYPQAHAALMRGEPVLAGFKEIDLDATTRRGNISIKAAKSMYAVGG